MPGSDGGYKDRHKVATAQLEVINQRNNQSLTHSIHYMCYGTEITDFIHLPAIPSSDIVVIYCTLTSKGHVDEEDDCGVKNQVEPLVVVSFLYNNKK